jgi:hypothetical protein
VTLSSLSFDLRACSLDAVAVCIMPVSSRLLPSVDLSLKFWERGEIPRINNRSKVVVHIGEEVVELVAVAPLKTKWAKMSAPPSLGGELVICDCSGVV